MRSPVLWCRGKTTEPFPRDSSSMLPGQPTGLSRLGPGSNSEGEVPPSFLLVFLAFLWSFPGSSCAATRECSFFLQQTQ